MKAFVRISIGLITLGLFWSCDFYGLSVPKFITHYTETAAIGSWEFLSASRISPNGTRIIYPGSPEIPETVIALHLRNPQKYDLILECRDSETGVPIPTIGVEQEQYNKALIYISDADPGDQFRITVSIQTANGLRRFDDFQLPLIKCYPELTLSGLKVIDDEAYPAADWSMQDSVDHPGIARVSLQYQQENGPVSSVETYGWEGNSLTGLDSVRKSLISKIKFPETKWPGRNPVDAYYHFKVTIEDDEGFTISAATPGFNVQSISPEGHLESIIVNNGTLTPAFNPSVFDYAVTVPYNVTDARVTVSAALGTSMVSPGTFQDLSGLVNGVPREAVFTVVDGLTTNVYTVRVTRKNTFDQDELEEMINGIASNGSTTITLPDYLDGQSIEINAPINIDSGKNVTIVVPNGKTISLERDGEGNLFSVSGGASLTLGSVGGGTLIIDGNNVPTITAQSSLIDLNGGTLTMYPGTSLINNTPGYSTSGGAVSMENNSVFTMEGGEIRSNNDTFGTSSGGGGVSVNTGSIFNMKGGTITANDGGSRGGGVLLWSNATLNMTGGIITGNTPDDVYVRISGSNTYNKTGGTVGTYQEGG